MLKKKPHTILQNYKCKTENHAIWTAFYDHPSNLLRCQTPKSFWAARDSAPYQYDIGVTINLHNEYALNIYWVSELEYWGQKQPLMPL